MPKWFLFCVLTLLLWGAWGVKKQEKDTAK